MVNSMTGFAVRTGSSDNLNWSWEIRSVNARGLDIRSRLPEGFDALEQPLQKKITTAATRGNITLNLKVFQSNLGAGLAVNTTVLEQVLSAQNEVLARAKRDGIDLMPGTAAEVLSIRGVLETDRQVQVNHEGEFAEILLDFDLLFEDFLKFRRVEGTAVRQILVQQMNDAGALIDQSAIAAEARRSQVEANFSENIAKLIGANTGVDPDRLAQEIALLAVKSDVTEEIDRLRVHVQTALGLLAGTTPVGRKLDFLAQEFNREANTLCSKSGSSVLTALGLDLKVVIDQFREQVQNVE
jgi:uncharacterized protein (TIGR00255 family)